MCSTVAGSRPRGSGRHLTTVLDVTAPTIRVLLVGAGGHSKVCLEALLDDPRYEVLGAVSSDGLAIDGFEAPVLGLDADLEQVARAHSIDRVFVAIGDNAARSAVSHRCETGGWSAATAISRFAMVSRSATIDDGVALLPGAVVNAGTSIGRGTIVNTNASVDHDCVIGEYVHIAPGVAIAGGVRIGAGTLIGLGARVLPNLTIGARAVVGAGAVVVNDVPDGARVIGVPARTSGRGSS
jgi:UDP-perosamine 4-acetyltransferase